MEGRGEWVGVRDGSAAVILSYIACVESENYNWQLDASLIEQK